MLIACATKALWKKEKKKTLMVLKQSHFYLSKNVYYLLVIRFFCAD